MSSCWPHDKCHGGQLRALHIARALRQLGNVTLVVAGSHDVDGDVRNKTAAEFGVVREMQARQCPRLGPIIRARSILDRQFTNIHGLAAGEADESWLKQTQKQFDLTWFFKLRTANYFANAFWSRSVLDVDDLPSTLEKSRLQGGGDFRSRLKCRVRIFELRRHEKRIGQRFSVLGVCSQADKAILGNGLPIHVIPNGFARPVNAPSRRPSQPPRIGFMGLYSYEPNLDGVRWFFEQCWPQIKAAVPGVRLRLVGADTDGPLRPDDPSVDGLGWLERPDDEVASWSLMIVPIRMGGGTRVKIPDAFSRKCPLVSTRFGALGYDVENGRELLLADEPRSFADACLWLIKDPVAATAMAERGFGAFLEKWTWEAVAPRVWETAEDCLRFNFGR